ncbi:MAG: hypothetical protein BHW17_06920 [Dorea sp. 42_8]|nr:MAG: hypothetical protein BHW17_06920 [Dorea sp. 42_8]
MKNKGIKKERRFQLVLNLVLILFGIMIFRHLFFQRSGVGKIMYIYSRHLIFCDFFGIVQKFLF